MLQYQRLEKPQIFLILHVIAAYAITVQYFALPSFIMSIERSVGFRFSSRY